MYNKLFNKILDSSIWLAPDPHRLVWITLLAAMDEDGNVMFASAANVAARARVPREQAEEALAAFEGPDPDSGDPDNEGRRIERFPGGWHVLNAAKYRALVTKAVIREQTRLRVARHREKSNGAVTHEKREANASVTPSEAVSRAEADTNTPRKRGDARKRARAPTFAMPADFSVSDQVRAWAKERGFDRLDEHLDAFRRKAKAKSYAYADWDAAFMEAIREDWAKLRGTGRDGQAPPPIRPVEVYRPEPPMTAEQKAKADAARQLAMSAIRRVG